MIETDVSELFEYITSDIFNDWEKRFLRDIRGKKYEQLSKHQKAVITRLYDWLRRH